MTQTQTETGTIAGYFEDSSKATQAIEALREAGFSSAHLGVAHRGGSTSATESRTGEKAAGAWDTIKNFFSGSDAEPYADERTQGDLANREITQNPNDATGQYGSQYDPSDLHHSLHGLAVPEDRSRYFGQRVNSNQTGAVVTVNARDRAAEAEAILTRFGADLGENAAEYDYSQGATTAQPTETQDAQNNIQLLGEVLRVHKDRISRGEVRLRKEVVTETQTVQVPVTREELVIERRAVNQETPTASSIGEGEEIRIPLSEERASIDKSTFVREEVAVGKKPVEEVRNLTGDVRHEELVVEDSTKRSA
jgi:uncharacterized protein (TIGR02271 family)